MKVLYLYNHDINELEEAAHLNEKSVKIYENTCYNREKAQITILRYCEHCNSTLVGHWQYIKNEIVGSHFDSYTRKKYEGNIRYFSDDLDKNCYKSHTYTINHYYITGYDSLIGNAKDMCYYYRTYTDYKNYRSPETVYTFLFDEKKYQIVEPYFKISPEIVQYRKEIDAMISMDACPICSRQLGKEKSHMAVSNDIWGLSRDVHYKIYGSSLENILEEFNSERIKDLTKSAEQIATQEVEELKEKFDIKPLGKTFNKNAFDTDGLKNYLNHICNLENNIFSICERLKELYALHIPSKKDSMASQLAYATEIRNKLTANKFAYAQLEKSIPEKSIPAESYAVNYPPAPVQPQMPQQPQLKPVGFFNKSKVEEENKLLMQQYQADVLAYNAQVEIYAKEAEKYNRIAEQLWQKQNEAYAALVAEAHKNKQEKLDKLNTEINILESKIIEIENGCSDIVTPEKFKNDLIESEIKEAEKTLLETYKALNELYSYDIIFGKYRDFVSVSTFYEYLASGRCSSLEGADGAYNLYENEIRANQIISQLSQVVVSLDKIQQSQYVIYSAICESNRQLQNLNRSMDSAVSTLDTMNRSLKSIANNTAAAAYNSAVTAYYSKKNAELTNALGFMIALS